MAAKSSMDEEQAMLANMHDSTEPSVEKLKAQRDSHQFLTPAFTLYESNVAIHRKLENFVIKYPEGQECATTRETLNLKDVSKLFHLYTKAYMSSSKLHTVVNWDGNRLVITPREDAEGTFTTFINGNALLVGELVVIGTGDVISCCKLAQPSREVNFGSIFDKGTLSHNDSDGPEEEMLTSPRRSSVKSMILDVLAVTMAAAFVIIFVVVVLGAVVIAILSLVMPPNTFCINNLVHFFRHDA